MLRSRNPKAPLCCEMCGGGRDLAWTVYRLGGRNVRRFLCSICRSLIGRSKLRW
jgi:hypothetical protein